jgi:hypothetical protein
MFGDAMNQIILPDCLSLAGRVLHVVPSDATIAWTEGTDEYRTSQR